MRPCSALSFQLLRRHATALAGAGAAAAALAALPAPARCGLYSGILHDEKCVRAWEPSLLVHVDGPVHNRPALVVAAAERLEAAFASYHQDCLRANKPPPPPVRITSGPASAGFAMTFTLPPAAPLAAVLDALLTPDPAPCELPRVELPGKSKRRDGPSTLARVVVPGSGTFSVIEPKPVGTHGGGGLRQVRLDVEAGGGGLSERAAARVAATYRLAHGVDYHGVGADTRTNSLVVAIERGVLV